jgi:hypothetical protein
LKPVTAQRLLAEVRAVLAALAGELQFRPVADGSLGGFDSV